MPWVGRRGSYYNFVPAPTRAPALKTVLSFGVLGMILFNKIFWLQKYNFFLTVCLNHSLHWAWRQWKLFLLQSNSCFIREDLSTRIDEIKCQSIVVSLSASLSFTSTSFLHLNGRSEKSNFSFADTSKYLFLSSSSVNTYRWVDSRSRDQGQQRVVHEFAAYLRKTFTHTQKTGSTVQEALTYCHW